MSTKSIEIYTRINNFSEENKNGGWVYIYNLDG